MRPYSQIAQLSADYECEILIRKKDLTVDAKSVLELMTLNACFGTELLLEANGEGAAEAIEELVRLFNSNFEDGNSADS